MMNRRHGMKGCCVAMAAGLFTGLNLGPHARASAKAGDGAGRPLINPCAPSGGAELQAIEAQAFEGLDATRRVDTHAHLPGTGDAVSGCSVHPSMYA